MTTRLEHTPSTLKEKRSTSNNQMPVAKVTGLFKTHTKKNTHDMKSKITIDRETAIQLYNDFCDKIGIDEDNRHDPNLNAAEKAEVKAMKENGESAEDIAAYIERCDKDREMIITAIRKGKITFDEEGDLIQVLDVPVSSTDGEIFLEKLKYKSKQYTVKDIDMSLRGVKEESPVQRTVRMIHLRTGALKAHIEQMKERDGQLANRIEMLFMMPDLPMK